jgi:hypothetical protein
LVQEFYVMFSKILLFALLAILPLPSASLAATVSYKLSATVVEGPGLGLVSVGSVSFDDSYLVTGDEILGPLSNGGVSIALDAGFAWFTEFEDSNYPDFPKLTFSQFSLVSIDYWVQNNVNGVDLAQYGILEFAFTNSLTGNPRAGYDVGVIVRPLVPAPVPLPASLPLLALALCAMAFAAKSQAKPKAVLIKG